MSTISEIYKEQHPKGIPVIKKIKVFDIKKPKKVRRNVRK